MNAPTDDYDMPWKSAIEAHFREFLAFYFPAAGAGIDWGHAPVFLKQIWPRLRREHASAAAASTSWRA